MVRTSKEELGVTSKAKPPDSSSSYGSLVPGTTLVLSTPWVNTPPASGWQVVGLPPPGVFCAPRRGEGRARPPRPDWVDGRPRALGVPRGGTCRVSCTTPPISFALVGGSSGPRRARVTRKRLGVSYATATLAAPPE